jgi:flagellar hook assembly protein FlgD
MRGEIITELEDVKNAGEHTWNWDGRDRAARSMPTGTYFCILQAEGWFDVIKMQLVR